MRGPRNRQRWRYKLISCASYLLLAILWMISIGRKRHRGWSKNLRLEQERWIFDKISKLQDETVEDTYGTGAQDPDQGIEMAQHKNKLQPEVTSHLQTFKSKQKQHLLGFLRKSWRKFKRKRGHVRCRWKQERGTSETTKHRTKKHTSDGHQWVHENCELSHREVTHLCTVQTIQLEARTRCEENIVFPGFGYYPPS